MKKYIEAAKQLRAQLHNCPELSMHEHTTKALIISFLKNTTELEIVDCGKWFYAVWHGSADPKRIAFRADYDAVCSANGTARHLCGHDGHSAILAAFAMYVSDSKPENSVYFIFQPGEENGEGALLCKNVLEEQHIDEIFGFHNIPGAELGTVLYSDGTFACASTGLEINLTGKPSHAAYPEAGINPSYAAAEIILEMRKYLSLPHRGVLLGTVIGTEIGSSAYGVSAGNAVIRLTLRGEFENEFNSFLNYMKNYPAQLCESYGIQCSLREIERFPSTENHLHSVERIISAAKSAKLHFEKISEPFRWSEDFGYYTQIVQGAFFGIGDGFNHPQLHTESYEFPDEIIPFVLNLYKHFI